MLARPNRLRLGRDIDRVYRSGRYGGGQLLSVKVLPSRTEQKRVVVVVGKKISKKATVRNRLRRQITELIQKNWQKIPPGYDIVVTVRAEAPGVTSEALEQSLLTALTKAAAIKG